LTTHDQIFIFVEGQFDYYNIILKMGEIIREHVMDAPIKMRKAFVKALAVGLATWSIYGKRKGALK
jgi:hypothetical protein